MARPAAGAERRRAGSWLAGVLMIGASDLHTKFYCDGALEPARAQSSAARPLWHSRRGDRGDACAHRHAVITSVSMCH